MKLLVFTRSRPIVSLTAWRHHLHRRVINFSFIYQKEKKKKEEKVIVYLSFVILLCFFYSSVPLFHPRTTPAVCTIATVMNIDILSSPVRHLETFWGVPLFPSHFQAETTLWRSWLAKKPQTEERWALNTKPKLCDLPLMNFTWRFLC